MPIKYGFAEYHFVLPKPRNEDYGSGVKGFVSAIVNKTNEHYKEKVRKEFDEWQDFKKKNKGKVIIDKEKEAIILDWLNSDEVSLRSELKTTD